MARAVWKGVIHFGDVSVPVKLYSAAQDRSVHFRLLSAKDKTPVKQRMVNAETGREVPPDRIRSGYETGRGVFVVLDAQELEGLEPEPSRAIEVTRFVEPEQIDHRWYDRPYYLGPDGDEAAYSTLTRALGGEHKEGVAHWVMRKKEYIGALRPVDEHLMLITLRHTGELVPADGLKAPRGRAPEPNEIAMAEQLIGALEGEFDPTDFRDEYRDRVLELVKTKAEGKTVALPKVRERQPPKESLTRVLEESLRHVNQEKRVA